MHHTNTVQDTIDDLFGEFNMEPGADYRQPLGYGSLQIYGRPLSQSTRRVCYDQLTYQDNNREGNEFFSLQVTHDPTRNLSNLVIDGVLGTALVTIVDDDGKFLWHNNMYTNQLITLCDQGIRRLQLISRLDIIVVRRMRATSASSTVSCTIHVRSVHLCSIDQLSHVRICINVGTVVYRLVMETEPGAVATYTCDIGGR